MGRLHHIQMSVTAKTLANHKSNVRAALRWFAKEESAPLRGAPLSPEWALLRDGIVDYRTRANTYSLSGSVRLIASDLAEWTRERSIP
jgi:hypothetical protein